MCITLPTAGEGIAKAEEMMAGSRGGKVAASP